MTATMRTHGTRAREAAVIDRRSTRSHPRGTDMRFDLRGFARDAVKKLLPFSRRDDQKRQMIRPIFTSTSAPGALQ